MAINTLTLTLAALRAQPDALVVTLGRQSTYGLLNDEKQIGSDGSGEEVTVHSRELFITANSLTSVVDGTTVTVRRKDAAPSTAVSYTVRGRPMPRENGDIWAIRLAKVES